MAKKAKKAEKAEKAEKAKAEAKDKKAATRTAMERLQEVQSILAKLESLGLSKEIAGVAAFLQTGREYVRSGESRSGSVPLVGLKRHIDYVLSGRKHVACTVNLRYDDSV